MIRSGSGSAGSVAALKPWQTLPDQSCQVSSSGVAFSKYVIVCLLNLHIRMLYAQRVGLYFYTSAFHNTFENHPKRYNVNEYSIHQIHALHLTVKSVISSFAINSGNCHQTCDGTVLQQLNFKSVASSQLTHD